MLRALHSLFNKKVTSSIFQTNRTFFLWRRFHPFFDWDFDNKYRLMLDVGDFHPKDVGVKVEGSKIKISANSHSSHKNWRDTTQIFREYDVPEDVDPASIKSSIESGVLVIEGDRRITGEATQLESDKEFIMSIDLNGFNQKDVTVNQTGYDVCIEAKQDIKNVESDQAESKLHRRFERHFTLPDNVDKENLSAKFTPDGRLVLSAAYISLPKPESKTLDIKTE